LVLSSLWGTYGDGETGPGSSESFGGPIVIATSFEVTAAGLALYGFGYWIADSSQSMTAGQVFCGWSETTATSGSLLAGTTVTAGAFSLGWNYVMLAAPVALTANVPYRVQTGYSSNGSGNNDYWGSGGPGTHGVINGPLTGFSDQPSAGTLPDPTGCSQSSFVTGVSDPTVNYGNTGFVSINTWLDVVVGPASAQPASLPLFTYRLRAT
jgi:hypothetical protein